MRVSQTETTNIRQSNKPTVAQEIKKNDRLNIAENEKTAKSSEGPEISQRSKEMSQAKLYAMDTPDVREDRVFELKKKIGDGSYKINNDAIADRLVENHLQSPELG